MARWPGIARWLDGRDPSVFGPMARRGSIADDPINSCGPMFSRTEADLEAYVESPSGMGGGGGRNAKLTHYYFSVKKYLVMIKL